MSRTDKILENLNQGVNPVTKRKFGKGPVGTVLTAAKEHIRKTPGPLGSDVWQDDKCKDGALLNGKCFKSKKQVSVAISLSKAVKDAQRINAKPDAKPSKPVKPIKPAKADIAALGKRYEALKAEKADINSKRRNAEVSAYVRKKNLEKALSNKKKLEANHKRLQNDYRMALNQLSTL
jgi:nitrogen fixation protein